MLTTAGIAAVMLTFAWCAWQRRWMSDDGLIIVRTVRQILAGNGPVINAFERAEADTSPLWTYLLVILAAITRANIPHLAVVTGGLLTVAGVGIALDATRRLHRRRGVTEMLCPAGAFVVLGAYPFWDYATSGLETGLMTVWLAALWWLLVTLEPTATRRRQLVTAITFGLGPLVRPDVGLATVVFLLAAWVIVRPSRRRSLGLGVAAVALPIAYEIFRAGYYGALVPLPAIAKSASRSLWGHGLTYLFDFVRPYWMWLPFTVLAVLGAIVISRRSLARRDWIVVAAPVVTGLLLATYVVRVGGDFMHARMLLPPTFLAVLPAMMLPVRRITAPAIALLAGWALVIGISLDDHESHTSGVNGIEDEHVGYVRWTGHSHPIETGPFVRADRPASDIAAQAMRERTRLVMIADARILGPMSSAHSGPIVYAAGRLGTGGAVVPLDGIVADMLGLANPLGARITAILPGYAGHEKPLPVAWLVADFVDPAAESTSVLPSTLRAARHAMSCGAFAELLASVREPMSLGRFWANFTGSIARTRLEIPSDPVEAEWKFCGADAKGIRVTASSSFEVEGFSRASVADGERRSVPGSYGYASHAGVFTDHEEWIALQYPSPRSISKVVLHSTGYGFPIDFKIQIWNGATWVDRVVKTNYPAPDVVPQMFEWQTADVTDQIRIVATHLSQVRGGYQLQLAEIEALGPSPP
ncbi:MAG: hypothetical protein JWO36_973 [Myxococcales bacterium]|nr:hypothetical protein [Myxococcales bacterium]